MRGLKRFFSRPLNFLALALVLFFFLVALAAPLLAPPTGPADVNTSFGLQFSAFREVETIKSYVPLPPGQGGVLGTIVTGRVGSQLDVFYTLVWGTRSALRFGLVVALATALIGTILGALAGFFGGWFNAIVLRFTDAFLAFPIIAGVSLLSQLAQPSLLMQWQESPVVNLFQAFVAKTDPVILAIILFSWMPYARIINSMVQSIKGADYFVAARALGSGPFRIIFRHLLPNAISPAVVLAARDIGGMVVLQASLTFIGMGGELDWGGMLAQGRHWIMGFHGNPFIYWWTFLPVTIALVLFGIGWNLLGDGLNDWLNPHKT